MNYRNQSLTQESAAAKAGISSRSGRRIEKQERPHQPHHWRTRADPLEAVWNSELVPLLEKESGLTPITLFEYLDDHYPGEYGQRIMRTLQRRVSDWKAQYGPDKAVIFRQIAQAGRQGLSDFSHPNAAITLGGKPFAHMFYQFCLAYSGWRSVTVIQGGESYAALSSGLQNALHQLGGSPLEHRTDSLSAARNNHTNRWTDAYQALCAHYGLEPTVNNQGKGHENGAIEARHGVLKRRLSQALKLRGSNDFATLEAYTRFVQKVVDKLNRRFATGLSEEKAVLQALPHHRFSDYHSLTVKVTRTSTIAVKHVLYSVPSRLIGKALHIHLYHDRLEGFIGQAKVVEQPRHYTKPGETRARQIDCRHVIRALSAKPQAFRCLNYRDQLFPTSTYQTLWSIADTYFDSREACKWMVRVLYIHCFYDNQLDTKLWQQWQQTQKLPPRQQLDKKALHTTDHPQQPGVQQHDLSQYNQLLAATKTEAHHVHNT